MMICNVVGARPNFMKMGPVIRELKDRGIPQILVHTGQHYDEKMSQVFFDDLGLSAPDVFLGVGSDTHARQTARIMMSFESVCLERSPGLILVGGDVNSTLAAALVGAKLSIPIAHLEAGLRSRDRKMPEEINRIVTDHLSDILLTTEESANENLREEGVADEKIHFVGNCMIDSLLSHVDRAVALDPWDALQVAPGAYALLTLHRPSNVDDHGQLAGLAGIMNEISASLPVIFPVHPRTQKQLKTGEVRLSERVRLCDPLPYLHFLGLMARARLVMTDSGGIQEETTALGVPCLTLRSNTERPSTLEWGTNRLVATDRDLILSSVTEILSGKWPRGVKPPLWDGLAAKRVVDVLQDFLNDRTPDNTAAARLVPCAEKG